MLTDPQHAQRKRIMADRYAMTNILREKPIAALRNRAETFLKRVIATAASVDVYVLLHCYALDGVTHFLFSPGGLRSLEMPEDFSLMEELSYHSSLQSKG